MLPYRWVRHLVTCISKYQTPGRASSAREEGEYIKVGGRHHGVPVFSRLGAEAQIPRLSPWPPKPTLCFSNSSP